MNANDYSGQSLWDKIVSAAKVVAPYIVSAVLTAIGIPVSAPVVQAVFSYGVTLYKAVTKSSTSKSNSSSSSAARNTGGGGSGGGGGSSGGGGGTIAFPYAYQLKGGPSVTASAVDHVDIVTIPGNPGPTVQVYPTSFGRAAVTFAPKCII